MIPQKGEAVQRDILVSRSEAWSSGIFLLVLSVNAMLVTQKRRCVRPHSGQRFPNLPTNRRYRAGRRQGPGARLAPSRPPDWVVGQWPVRLAAPVARTVLREARDPRRPCTGRPHRHSQRQDRAGPDPPFQAGHPRHPPRPTVQAGDVQQWRSSIPGSGRGAAWLARLLGVQEVPSSNLGGPTKRFKELQTPPSSQTPAWSPLGVQTESTPRGTQ